MSRRAYLARRAQRAHRQAVRDGNGITIGPCLACTRRQILVDDTGYCHECVVCDRARLPHPLDAPLRHATLESQP